MFKIQRNAFAFDEYVKKVFEKFVLSIIEIRLIDWIVLTIFLFINLARNSLGLNLHSCQRDDISCINDSSLKLFTISGMLENNIEVNDIKFCKLLSFLFIS